NWLELVFAGVLDWTTPRQARLIAVYSTTRRTLRVFVTSKHCDTNQPLRTNVDLCRLGRLRRILDTSFLPMAVNATRFDRQQSITLGSEPVTPSRKYIRSRRAELASHAPATPPS